MSQYGHMATTPEIEHSNAIIDALGGATELARLIEAPVSTVHSWRTIGIPRSRMAHIRLVAQVEGKELPSAQSAAA